MASLSITLSEVKANVGMILGIGRDPAGWDANLTADVNRIIRAGRRRFYGTNDWKHLREVLSVVTAAPQTTGTVSITAGVVTLTGSVWPADAATNWFLSVGSGIHEINTRDSDTQLTLLDTSVSAAALSAYTLYKQHYDLPSDFGGLEGPVILENEDRGLREVAIIPEFEIRTLANRTSPGARKPEMFAVGHRIANPDDSIPTHYLSIYPLVDAVHVLKMEIKKVPEDLLDLADATIASHPAFARTIAEAVYSEAEVAVNNIQGVHSQLFAESLVNAIRIDRAMASSRASLARGTRDRRDRLWGLRNGTSEWTV